MKLNGSGPSFLWLILLVFSGVCIVVFFLSIFGVVFVDQPEKQQQAITFAILGALYIAFFFLEEKIVPPIKRKIMSIFKKN